MDIKEVLKQGRALLAMGLVVVGLLIFSAGFHLAREEYGTTFNHLFLALFVGSSSLFCYRAHKQLAARLEVTE